MERWVAGVNSGAVAGELSNGSGYEWVDWFLCVRNWFWCGVNDEFRLFMIWFVNWFCVILNGLELVMGFFWLILYVWISVPLDCVQALAFIVLKVGF